MELRTACPCLFGLHLLQHSHQMCTKHTIKLIDAVISITGAELSTTSQQ